MAGPGTYVADVTEGIDVAEDLPEPRITHRSRDYKRRACPQCGGKTYRKRALDRRLRDLGKDGRPHEIHLTVSQHYCPACKIYFLADTSDLAASNAHYTHAVVRAAVRLVVEDGLPYAAASWHLWRDHRVHVPEGTVQNWAEAAGEKSGRAGQGRRLPR